LYSSLADFAGVPEGESYEDYVFPNVNGASNDDLVTGLTTLLHA